MHIGNILVRRYVGALFAVAKEKELLDQVYNALKNLDNAFKEVPELIGFIVSPEVTAFHKLEVLSTSVGQEPPEPLKRFFQLVLSKNREEILPSVFVAFFHFREEALGRVQVTVTTAVTITPAMKDNITRHVSSLTDKTPVIQWNVDTELLGGYRILIDNRSYDFSLIRQLDNLQERMAG
ncbi:hypothetical protein AMJ86_03545 [bacterium SM23_57]|nr:MAG: hypothetical protein AMJ86_03545 [bacterium SM23_57]